MMSVVSRVIAVVAGLLVGGCIIDTGPHHSSHGDTGGSAMATDGADTGGPHVCYVSPDCDPLSPMCEGTQICVPTSTSFQCMDSLDGTSPLGLGEACSGALACGEGLVCVSVSVPGCTGDPGCCVALCELDAADCPDALTCQPYFSVAVPCYDTVGVCV